MEGSGAQLIMVAASPSVGRVFNMPYFGASGVSVPPKGVSPLLPPSPEAVATAAAALAMAIGSKGRFRAKKWARMARAGEGASLLGALLPARLQIAAAAENHFYGQTPSVARPPFCTLPSYTREDLFAALTRSRYSIPLFLFLFGKRL